MRDVKLMKQETEKVLKRLGLDLDPGTPVSELSVGLCQMVEIAKAVSKNASILVLMSHLQLYLIQKRSSYLR